RSARDGISRGGVRRKKRHGRKQDWTGEPAGRPSCSRRRFTEVDAGDAAGGKGVNHGSIYRGRFSPREQRSKRGSGGGTKRTHSKTYARAASRPGARSAHSR